MRTNNDDQVPTSRKSARKARAKEKRAEILSRIVFWVLTGLQVARGVDATPYLADAIAQLAGAILGSTPWG